MKNWLYIPFLVLMAVTYTKVSDNFSEQSMKPASRAPASVESMVKDVVEDKCIDLPSRFNPHSITKNCF